MTGTQVLWLVVGTIYAGLAAAYFILAYKARKGVKPRNLKIEEIPVEPFMPKNGSFFEVNVTVSDSGIEGQIRNAVLAEMVDRVNHIARAVQCHLNASVLPDMKRYLDRTARINMIGFIVAGALSGVAAALAFLSAFLIL